jgi:hypothetical protein
LDCHQAALFTANFGCLRFRRTTLTLPDGVYGLACSLARSLARSKNLSLGDALAELVRKGVRPAVGNASTTGFPCFSVAPDAPPITLEKTFELEDGR